MTPLSLTSLPGSKSMAQRALICAALCKNTTVLKNVPDGDDVQILIQALKQCGVQITQLDETTVEISPPKKFTLQNSNFNVGHGGTPLRFLISFLGLIPGEKTLDGSERLRERPILSLIQSLQDAGADITGNKLPLKIQEKSLHTDISLEGSKSSQFISSVLLSGVDLGVQRIVVKGKTTSSSYINLTQKILSEFGIHTKETVDGYLLSGEYASPGTYTIEPDWASAGYMIGAALLRKKEIIIPHLLPSSFQPDAGILPILESMGVSVNKTEKGLLISCSKGIESPGTVNCELFPDSAQTIAVLAAFCDNEKTVLTGLHTLPLKECNRLEALHIELKKMGIQTEITTDSITIHGGIPHAATIETYDDHRMAMTFGMAQVRLPKLEVKNTTVVSKSFPQFWKTLSLLKNEKQQYFVIGDPVQHSLSPNIYQAGFEELGMKNLFDRQKVSENELEKYLLLVRANDQIQGLAITAPLKKSAALLVDELIGEAAQSLQTINTFWKESGKLLGANTDVDGIREVLSKQIFPGAKILILGAGDTAKSILQALSIYDVQITITNRTAEKAKLLTQDFDIKTTNFSQIEQLTSPDILISALPFGCEPVFSDVWMENVKTVFCVGYGKELPLLLSQAKQLHCEIKTGGDFLLAQWNKQFKLLTGQTAPLEMAHKTLSVHTPLTK